jgi:type IX secretion system PorP/SprF family membrane protein
MKKPVLTIGLFMLAALQCMAQQRPYYTQYILNNFIVNPAVAGIENYTDVKLSHRHQWVGLDGAPVTTYLTIHAPLKKSDYDVETATTFHPRGFNPRGQAYWQDYQRPDNHAGVGLTIMNDRTGPLNTFEASATYAYHLGIAAQTTLSMGVSAGISNTRLDASKLYFGQATGSYDPAVGGAGYLNNFKPTISAGMWLYSRDYFVGLAAQNIVPQKLVYNTSVKYGDTVIPGKLVPHLFLSAGYRVYLTEDVTFLPSGVLRFISPLPVGFDANVKFQYQDLIWAGASYRLKDGYAAMLGVNLSNSINIGYSYDLTTSRLNTVSKGTHEVVVGFLLNNKYGDWCPRNLW